MFTVRKNQDRQNIRLFSRGLADGFVQAREDIASYFASGLLDTVAFMMPYPSPFVLRYVIDPMFFTDLLEIFLKLFVSFLRSKNVRRVTALHQPQCNFR